MEVTLRYDGGGDAQIAWRGRISGDTEIWGFSSSNFTPILRPLFDITCKRFLNGVKVISMSESP